jgi:hypothetical protein
MKTTPKSAHLIAFLSTSLLCMGASILGPIIAGAKMSGGGGGDPSYSSVVALLHFNGSDGSTTFTDNSPAPKTYTGAGNAQIDTAQSQFGGASALFDGTGDYISTPDHADLELGSGDFTIEFWVRFANVAGSKALVMKSDASTTEAPFLIFCNTTALTFWSSSNGTAWDIANNSAIGTVATGTWYHVAVTRSGNTIRKFLNGTKNGADVTTSATLHNNAHPLYIGGIPSTWYHNGWIDDLRITKGVCRYTADFTPPAAQFPDS